MTEDDSDWLAERFEEHRPHLRAVAYRMLGSLSEADDAVQEAWLRLSRADTERDREPRRLADHGRRARVPGHAAVAPVAAARSRSTPTCPSRSPSRRPGRPRARGAAGRLGRARAARRARHADPGRAARVRAARHVRRAVRRDRADRRPLRDRRPASSPAARGAACSGQDADAATPTSLRQREVVDAFLAAARATATSTRCSPSSIPTSCCAPTRRRCSSARRRRPAGPPSVAAFSRFARGAKPALLDGAPAAVVDAGRPAARRLRLHGQRRQDRRDRPHRRPGAPEPARPGDPRSGSPWRQRLTEGLGAADGRRDSVPPCDSRPLSRLLR